MHKSITLAGVLAPALLVATAFVHAGGSTTTAATIAPLQAHSAPSADKVANYLPILRVGCVANGTPSEFPNDILFTNKGSKLNAGTKLRWTFSSPNHTGTFTLASALNPGASVRASNVIPGGIEAGRYCSVVTR